MVIAAFQTGEKYAVNYTTLDQYDYGQLLRIQGLKLPKTVEVHFSTQETGGTSITRVGVTKDGVTDVLIPDSVLENGDTTQNYSIFAFVYVTDATSGKTEYRAKLEVKARPKPEVPGGGDNPNIFHEAVLEVRKSAEKAEEAQRQAEGWAHGREDLPERAEDNAMYYAGKASEDAKKTAQDRAEVERLVESVSGIDEQVTKVEELSKNAQEAATQAGTSAEQAELHKQAAETASSAAQAAAQETEADRTSVEKTKETVENLSAQVQKNKESVDKTTQDFTLKAQQALADVNNAGQTQTERVQTAGTTAVGNIKTAQNTATQAVETAKTEVVKAVQTEGTTQTGNVTTEGERQVQAVQTAAQEIIADREQIAKNKTEIADLRRNKADAIVESVSGTLLNVKDSSGAFFEDFSMSGKTTQDGTPTPDAPVEIVNAGQLNSDTGKYEIEIKVTGKNIFNVEKLNDKWNTGVNYYYIPLFVGKGSSVSFSVSKKLTTGLKVYALFSREFGGNEKAYSWIYHSSVENLIKDKGTFVAETDVISLSFAGDKAILINELFNYLQVEISETPTAYEPYKEQTLTLTSDHPLTKWDRLVEQDGQIGWLYGSKSYKVTGKENFESREGYNTESHTNRFFILSDLPRDKSALIPLAYVEKLKYILYCYSPNIKEEGFDTNSDQFHIKLSNDRVGILASDDKTVRTSKFSEYMKKIYEDGKPIELLYMTTDTTFTPLPQEQQNAIRALQTYYPTTVIHNSEDMEMQLTYVADTKNYTDNKIKEAVSAQTQSLANLLSLMPLSTQAAMIEADTNNILDNMEVQK